MKALRRTWRALGEGRRRGKGNRFFAARWLFGWRALVVGGLSAAVSCGTNGDLSLGRFPAGASLGGAGSGGAPADGGGDGDIGVAGYGGYPVGFGGDFPSCSPGSALPVAAHRYDFTGSGTALRDRGENGDGEVFGGALLDDSGVLLLDGEDDYVNLPNGILGEAGSVSILLWVRLEHGPAYWRIFDFGTSSDGEDPTAEHYVGTYYIALTPETGLDQNGLALLVAYGGPGSEQRATTSIQIAEQWVALGIVLDGETNRASLYFSGRVVAETDLIGPLSEFDDVNNWLGRSNYGADPHVRGAYDELRVYHEALSACEVSALTALGPDDPG